MLNDVSRISALCSVTPELPEALVAEHVARLDEAYFASFPDVEIIRHLRSIQSLKGGSDADLWAEETKTGAIAITLVCHDHNGLFASLTGILALNRLDIQGGKSFTYIRADQLSGVVGFKPSRAKVIDTLLVRPEPGPYDLMELEAKLRNQIREVLELLSANHQAEARSMLHGRIGRLLAVMAQGKPLPRLQPLEIAIHSEGVFTVLEISGQDTPAFLFSLGNALGLMDCRIHKVDITTDGGRVRDTLWLTRQDGRSLSEVRWGRLRAGVALIKQFTALLPHAPDPDLAIRQFYLFLDNLWSGGDEAGVGALAAGGEGSLPLLARLFGTGTYLWEEFAKMQFHQVRALFTDLQGLRHQRAGWELRQELRNLLEDAQDTETRLDVVNSFKDRELFRTDLAHQAFPRHTFAEFSRQLTLIAETVVDAVFDICSAEMDRRYGKPLDSAGLQIPYVVLALGKFGGSELGYASDLEIAVVYDSEEGTSTGGSFGAISSPEYHERLVQRVMSGIRAKHKGIFELDLRLRPWGDAGPLASSLQAWEKWYQPGGGAMEYERQALLKLRAVSGDRKFAARLELRRDDICYAGHPVDLDAFFALRAKQMEYLGGNGRRNAKFSAGGLVDLEYTVQLLQRLHGHEHSELRRTNTLDALQALLEVGVLSAGEFEKLHNAYAFLRRLINALRIVRGDARDLVIPEFGSDEFHYLVRRLGYQSRNQLSGEERLQADIERHFSHVDRFVELKFHRRSAGVAFRPGFAEVVAGLADDDLRDAVLRDLGVDEPGPVYAELRSLYRKTTHPESILSSLVLSENLVRSSPDPGLSLMHFASFLESAGPEMASQLVFHPGYLEILFAIFGQSEYLTSVIRREPQWVVELFSSSELERIPAASEYRERMETVLGALKGEERMDRLRRFRDRELLLIALRDVHKGAPLPEIVTGISELTECVVDEVLRIVLSRRGISDWYKRQAVLALGKLGGSELNYSSDIDLVFLATDPEMTASEGDELEAAYREFIRELTVQTGSGQLYRVDLNLRPYGAQGEILTRHSAWEPYYREKAQGWEWQAFLKARPVAGDLDGGRRACALVQTLLVDPDNRTNVENSIARLRAQVLDRLRRRDELEWEVKNGPGGIRTAEFYIQGLQVRFGSSDAQLLHGNTLRAMSRLEETGILDSREASTLRDHYVFLRTVEHRLQMFSMLQVHLLPHDAGALQKLGLRMGFEDVVGRSAGERFLEEYRKHRDGLCSLHRRMFPAIPDQ